MIYDFSQLIGIKKAPPELTEGSLATKYYLGIVPSTGRSFLGPDLIELAPWHTNRGKGSITNNKG